MTQKQIAGRVGFDEPIVRSVELGQRQNVREGVQAFIGFALAFLKGMFEQAFYFK